ncbi:response regulator transcription factor [Alteromonas sp. 14N.309.X.WAT.G.H12]|uniref:response regulator transcription factor n=1 Tax=Alteromonas sp. 14N.309.X.WAT.G.H12 TaxID=3120824 RepID=UPI002FD48609
MTRILVADDHPLFREALSAALEPHFKDAEILEADSLESTLKVLGENDQVDLLLLDLNMPGGEYFNGLISVKDSYPALPIAVISANESIEVVAQVMGLGAEGFIPKSTPTAQIAEAIITVKDGGSWVPETMKDELENVDEEMTTLLKRFRELTPKQIQVLSYLRAGLMNKQIAHEMNVTEATIKAHISAILRKLEINTRTQAVLLMDKLQFN